MICKICDHNTELIKIGKYPITGYRCDSVNESINEPKFDMVLQLCKNCGMVNYVLHNKAFPILDKLYSSHTSTYYNTDMLSKY